MVHSRCCATAQQRLGEVYAACLIIHVLLGLVILAVVLREIHDPHLRRPKVVESGAIYWLGPTASVRVTRIWILLCVLTALSWFLGTVHREGQFQRGAAVTVGVLAIAFVKARTIIRHFMDVRAAPRWLRLVTDGWLAGLLAVILALCLF